MNEQRAEACAALLRQARSIVDADGTGEAALEQIKELLVKLADQGEALFPRSDFAMPDAHGRNHVLALEDGDGMGLYLTIALPGKEAAPHDHGIWCVNAAISGQEVHRFYRRSDDGTRDGYATVAEIGEVMVSPGQGMAMADHAIHATEVVGDAPAIGLALRICIGAVPIGGVVPSGIFHCQVWRKPSGGGGVMGFRVTIANTGTTIDCSADQRILHAAVGAGVDYPYACATGNCAACISELRAGEVAMLPYSDNALSAAQVTDRKILACRARPLSDVEVVWLGRGRR